MGRVGLCAEGARWPASSLGVLCGGRPGAVGVARPWRAAHRCGRLRGLLLLAGASSKLSFGWWNVDGWVRPFGQQQRARDRRTCGCRPIGSRRGRARRWAGDQRFH